MAIIEKGRICIVTRGSDTGKEVSVKEVMDQNFVKVAGPEVKERRCNIKHLEPTNRTGDIKTKTPKAPKEKKKQTTKKETKKASKPATTKKKSTKKPVAKKKK